MEAALMKRLIIGVIAALTTGQPLSQPGQPDIIDGLFDRLAAIDALRNEEDD